MREWMRTLLFLSAFSPTLLVLALVRYEIHGFQADVVQLLVIGLIGIVIPLLILKLIIAACESVSFEAKKIKPNDFVLLAFIGSYFTPLIIRAAELSYLTGIIVVVVLAVVLWLTNSIPAHPLLRAFKYRFYEVESSSGVVYTLISKREIIDPKQIKSIKKISSSMIMESHDVL